MHAYYYAYSSVRNLWDNQNEQKAQDTTMNITRRIKASLLSIPVLFSLTTLQGAAAPAYDAPATEENALALLKEYDPEGYYIVQTGIAAGESTLSFWLMSPQNLAPALDTAVHEEFHGYTHIKNGMSGRSGNRWVQIETIYLGKEKGDIIIDYQWADGTAYKTENFTKTIPENMRTFRYNTYVAENADPSANQVGIYGLINEYAAYHWGFYNQLALYPYYKANNVFSDFFNSCINDYQAYEEFRYWTLGLLNYEKTHAPEQYKVHMNNKAWCKAYYEITMRFRAAIDTFTKLCNETTVNDSWTTYPRRLADEKESRGINMLEAASSDPALKAIEDMIFINGGAVPPEEAPGSMYRLYNPNSGEHFYTAEVVERNALIIAGWRYEGVGWTAPEKSNTPVYRLYNKNAGDHHYTTDAHEREVLISVGWTDEKIGWYSDDSKGVPLYRQYNPNAKAGSHNYTTDKHENDTLVSFGWIEEGIGWYGINE